MTLGSGCMYAAICIVSYRKKCLCLQRDDELLPHLQAASQDAAGGGEEGEEADMSLGSHPVALSSGTLTAENSPTGVLLL